MPRIKATTTELPRTRIAVVSSHPIQYFSPLFAYLNQDEALEVTALYCSDFSLRGAKDSGFGQVIKWDVDLLAGYSSVFLGDRSKKRIPGGFWSLIVPEIWAEIRSGDYDVVWLHGYAYAAFVIAYLAAKSRRIPVFMRSETQLRLIRSPWRRRLRDGVLSFVYRFVHGFLAIGTKNREYYLSLGVPGSKIFDVPYTVDNDRFIRAAILTDQERISVRRKLGLPDHKPVILYASKFMRRKHPDDVLRAAAELREQSLDFAVLMVGSGEMEAELKALAKELGLMDTVFPGFINQSELPEIYSACNVFVLPTENEPWGLVVNEVMCAGLPVVISEEAGCAADLVEDGINGYKTEARNVDSLVTAVSKILTDRERPAEMGKQSVAMIRRWSYEECRVGVLKATESIKPDEMVR